MTGASSGLGVAFAEGLAEAGAHVAIGARRADKLQATKALVERHGRRCVAMATDITVPEDCTALVEKTVADFGHVDILINNAGAASAVPATRETPDAFRAVAEVNLFGSYWMAQACGRAMGPGSSIVNIGSVLGSTTAALPQAAYSSSKAALVGLTRDLAQQWSGRKGIRVNLVAPGMFDTDMTDAFPPEYVDTMMAHRVPMARRGNTDELVAAIVFLASDASSYITGALLPVDGGMLTT
ncbi:MAG: SDR family oxidoreductase [Actinomycetota bacterium]|nr:SDR family oxidoreductase [Actinomycetota bacterium]